MTNILVLRLLVSQIYFMDSITQVVLGAACGELVAGKKMGNRAMIWGGVGGTIPDLDVLANFCLDPLHAMVFHRGPMHSLIFAVVMPFILGPLVKKIYDGDWHTKRKWKWIGYGLGLLLYVLASFVIYLIANLVAGHQPWFVIIALILPGGLYFYKRYLQVSMSNERIPNVSTLSWIGLFFWAIFTHPLLDALTTYGTQLFWPFSNVRIALSSVAIVDPMYTVPFATCLLVASTMHRQTKFRPIIVWSGTIFSTLFLALTVFNKQRINSIFEKTLQENQMDVTEYMTVPTIFNNALWFAIGKQDSTYVCGYYSIFDRERSFAPLQEVTAHHELMEAYSNQYPAKVLPWFSDGYYAIELMNDSTFHYYDLRFGSTNGNLEHKEGIIFKMKLVDRSGVLEMIEENRPENKREDIEWFKNRIFGK